MSDSTTKWTANGKYHLLALTFHRDRASLFLNEVKKSEHSGSHFARIIVDEGHGWLRLPPTIKTHASVKAASEDTTKVKAKKRSRKVPAYDPLQDDVLLLRTNNPIDARNSLLVRNKTPGLIGIQLIR